LFSHAGIAEDPVDAHGLHGLHTIRHELEARAPADFTDEQRAEFTESMLLFSHTVVSLALREENEELATGLHHLSDPLALQYYIEPAAQRVAESHTDPKSAAELLHEWTSEFPALTTISGELSFLEPPHHTEQQKIAYTEGLHQYAAAMGHIALEIEHQENLPPDVPDDPSGLL
jgi:hypothetical protein